MARGQQPMHGMDGLVVLDYGTVRLRWCAASLRALLRRWGIAIVVGGVVLGSGTSVGFSAMGGLLAMAVFPLVDALQRPLPQQLLQVLAHSMLGALLLVAVRPLLWPRAWAEAESALPLPRATLRRSDLTVLVWALAPLWLTHAAGAAIWLAALPAHPPFSRGHLVALLLLSAALSLGWGLLMLHFTRWPLSRRPAGADAPEALALGGLWAAHWAWVLVALPLRRGPALRAGRLLLVATATLAMPALALALWPLGGPWWLAALAAAGMALTTRLHAVITADLMPLHQACVALPLRQRPLRLARQALALMPISLALALAAVVVLALQVPVRPAVLAAYGAACFGFNLLLVTWHTRPDASKPSARVAFWLFMQVVLLALASEVLA